MWGQEGFCFCFYMNDDIACLYTDGDNVVERKN